MLKSDMGERRSEFQLGPNSHIFNFRVAVIQFLNLCIFRRKYELTYILIHSELLDGPTYNLGRSAESNSHIRGISVG
jgi:hypothetical protein